MAYTVGNRGPLPNLVGELVGNYNPQLPPGPFNSQKEYEQSLPDWSRMRAGRPCPTPSATSEELALQGWIGVYLTSPVTLPAGAVAVPTPDWMLEPPASR